MTHTVMCKNKTAANSNRRGTRALVQSVSDGFLEDDAGISCQLAAIREWLLWVCAV
jgi:hypothetical protein